MTNRGKRQLRTAGAAWGPERVALGLSVRQLESLSGIHRTTLSLVEAGRLIPTAAEYQAVTEALRKTQGEIA
jgi:transcriptional regulator with XRE-family HTH domain